jgi:hypothetical protein
MDGWMDGWIKESEEEENSEKQKELHFVRRFPSFARSSF